MLFIRNKGADKTDTPLDWSPAKEKHFQSKKSRALSLFKDITSCASCNDVGLSAIIQSIVYKNRAGELRENIIQSYFDGQLLSEKEVQFLALTSQELNKFIDKERYQKYVDLLSPEFINQLEINITEQILDDYYKAREVVSNKRERYLEHKNESTKKKIEKNSLDFFDRTSKPGLSFQRHQQQSVKKQVMKQLAAKSQLSAGDSRSRASSANKPADDTAHHKAHRSYHVPRVYSDFRAKHRVSHSGLFGDVPDAEHYRLRHPPSKLVPATTSLNKHTINDIKDLQRDQLDKRVLSTAPKPPGFKTTFYFAYSAGPQGIKRLEKRRKVLSKHRAATLIQKAWKGFLARKNLRNLRVWANEAMASLPTQLQSQPQSKPREALKRPDSNTKKLLRRVTFQNKETNPPQRDPRDSRYSPRTRTDSLPSTENASNNPLRRSSRKNSSRIEDLPAPAPDASAATQTKTRESLQQQQLRNFEALLRCGNLKQLAALDHKLLRKCLNSPCEDGSFPVELAVQANNVELLALLVENGLNLKLCNLDPEKLFELAESSKSFKVPSTHTGEKVPRPGLQTEAQNPQT